MIKRLKRYLFGYDNREDIIVSGLVGANTFHIGSDIDPSINTKFEGKPLRVVDGYGIEEGMTLRIGRYHNGLFSKIRLWLRGKI